jgi:choline dehydrogenase-like flavoprotein
MRGWPQWWDAGVPFYQRDKKLVRVCLIKAKNADGENFSVPSIVPVSPLILRRALGQSAHWERRLQKAIKSGSTRPGT